MHTLPIWQASRIGKRPVFAPDAQVFYPLPPLRRVRQVVQGNIGENVMTHGDSQNRNRASLSRRGTIGALTVGAAALAAGARAATPDMGPATPPSTVTTPPRDFSPNGAPTTYFMDPDII